MIRRAINSSTSASTNDPDNIQNDIDQLNLEIEALSDAARTKEIEWNNILYLKKMKEDILQRLTRKKTVVEILSSKSIDNPESLYSNNGSFENLPDLNANEAKKPSANTITPTTSFIMSRCNMKSVDLAKEKSNLNELHRLVSRSLGEVLMRFYVISLVDFSRSLSQYLHKHSKFQWFCFGCESGIACVFYFFFVQLR